MCLDTEPSALFTAAELSLHHRDGQGSALPRLRISQAMTQWLEEPFSQGILPGWSPQGGLPSSAAAAAAPEPQHQQLQRGMSTSAMLAEASRRVAQQLPMLQTERGFQTLDSFTNGAPCSLWDAEQPCRQIARSCAALYSSASCEQGLCVTAGLRCRASVPAIAACWDQIWAICG